MYKLKYFIPNSLTALNLFLGAFAMMVLLDSSSSNLEIIMKASWFIVIASLFDGLDGKVARLTNTQSKFGVEFDSLADFCAFVLSPAFITYKVLMLNIPALKPIIMLGVILYILGGGVRLARYNVIQGSDKKKGKFLGLPTPAAAGNLISVVLFLGQYSLSHNVNFTFWANFLLIDLFVTSFLMVSSITYDNIVTMFRMPRRFYLFNKFSPTLLLFIIFLSYLFLEKKLAYFFIVFIGFYHLKTFLSILGSKFLYKEVEVKVL